MKSIAAMVVAVCCISSAYCQTQTYSGMDAGQQCLEALPAQAEFEALRGKVPLGRFAPSVQMYANREVPTEAERPVILAWALARDHCSAVFFAGIPSVPVRQIVQTRDSNLDVLIGKLYNKELTYGAFAEGWTGVYNAFAEQGHQLLNEISNRPLPPIEPFNFPDANVVPQPPPKPSAPIETTCLMDQGYMHCVTK